MYSVTIQNKFTRSQGSPVKIEKDNMPAKSRDAHLIVLSPIFGSVAIQEFAEQPHLLKLIALVSDQDVHHTLAKENGVEVVVPEEDSQLIGPQAFPQRCQAVVRQLARAAFQKILLARHNCVTYPSVDAHVLLTEYTYHVGSMCFCDHKPSSWCFHTGLQGK